MIHILHRSKKMTALENDFMKVFVLGLDGATFDLLNPLMDEDVIPNIKSICSNWASGPLRTIFPPVTGPAWLALATGLNPGKTGIFDYINRKSPDSFEMAPVSSAYYRNRAIWDILGKQGYKVGIFNYPTLSPAPKVNGFAVSGVGAYNKERLCFPEDLETELNDIIDNYELKLNLKAGKYKRNIHLFFDDLNRVISKQVTALRYLVKEKEWDFFFAVFHFTDWMQHILWKYIDDTHPLYDPVISRSVKNKFKDTWKKIDEIIGELFNLFPDTAFMFVSDHGFGPLDSAFYPNAWLEKRGWLKKKNLGWRGFLAEKVKPLSADIDNKYFNAMLHLVKSRVLKKQGTMDLIDLDNSLAFSPEHAGMYGCISLTPKGRKTFGFKDQLIQELDQMSENIDGIKQVEMFLPEKIYSGPYVNLAPDILFVINGYRSSVEIDITKEPFSNSPSIDLRTGSHRSDGVFMAKGDIFRNIRLQNVSVLDIAPTILALYDVEIPSQIDGRVITESISPQILQSMNIRRSKEIIDVKDQVEEKGDLEEMKKTLESLGYM
jgi:predicted AlkP superfamily phosphohydrolase/phosphomutase